MKSIVIAWVVCVVGLAGLFAWVGPSALMGKRPQPQAEALVKAQFTLQHGPDKTITANDLRGKYLLVYFGFTHCPDICPTSLLVMNNAIEGMGKDANKIIPVFITVDPARDTPQLTDEYARRFGERTLGLSGTDAQVREAADSFKVYYSIVEDKESALGYVVDHSGFIYLIGPDGNYITHFDHTVSEQELTLELSTYVQ
jgi:protein SCO1/2